MKTRLVLALMLAFSIPFGIASANPIIIEPFNTTPSWVTNGRDPTMFGSVFYDGDRRLEVGVTKADYDPSNFVQGKMTSFSGISAWSTSIDILNDSFSKMALNRNNPNPSTLIRGWGEFWAMTDSGPLGMGIRFVDESDPFNGRFINPTLMMYNQGIFNWVPLQSFGMITGDFWMNLKITGGDGPYSLFLNDNLLYVGAFNPGSLTGVGTSVRNMNSPYTTYFDNLDVSNTAKHSAVPDAGSTGIMAAIALVGLVTFRRFNPKLVPA